MQAEQKTETRPANVGEAIYNKIFNDPRVQSSLGKLKSLLEFPDAPFIAIVIGSGQSNSAVSFAILPLIGLGKVGVIAGAAGTAIQSAARDGSISVGGIFSILQLLGSTGSLIPAVVVGSVVAGGVEAVKVLRRKGNSKGGGKGKEGEECKKALSSEKGGEASGVSSEACEAGNESPSQVGESGGSNKNEQSTEEEAATLENKSKEGKEDPLAALHASLAAAAQKAQVWFEVADVSGKLNSLASKMKAKL